MTKEQIAYIAGVVDSDGCIHINKSPQKLGRSIDYTTEITIVNTNEKLITWINNLVKGSIYNHKFKNVKHKDTFRWRISRKVALKLLKQIEPYLVIKKEQALIAISLEQRKVLGTTNKLPIKELSFREKVYTKIKQLNRRGKETPVVLET